jgi:hypothetical protein
MNVSRIAVLALACSAFTSPISAATVASGDNTVSFGDCTPGCTPTDQTAYASSLFSGAIPGPGYVTSVTLFLNAYETAPMSLYLTTTPTGVGNLSSDFSDNRGTDFAFFASSIVTQGTRGAVTFNGAFYYDPTRGDLLVETDNLRVLIDSAYSNNALAQRVYSFGDYSPTGTVNSPGYAYTARFEFGPLAAAVPEPATWAMLILGFGAIGGMMRRRSATAMASRMHLTYA